LQPYVTQRRIRVLSSDTRSSRRVRGWSSVTKLPGVKDGEQRPVWNLEFSRRSRCLYEILQDIKRDTIQNQLYHENQHQK